VLIVVEGNLRDGNLTSLGTRHKKLINANDRFCDLTDAKIPLARNVDPHPVARRQHGERLHIELSTAAADEAVLDGVLPASAIFSNVPKRYVVFAVPVALWRY
jgi:hypothetical protein